MPPMYNPISRHFLLPIFIPIFASLSIFFFFPDPQPEPQCDLSDQFPSRVQVHSRPYSLPEAGQIPGGYHLHGEHSCHQGEWHLLCHLHPALRSGRMHRVTIHPLHFLLLHTLDTRSIVLHEQVTSLIDTHRQTTYIHIYGKFSVYRPTCV